jgi:hypothetical protein
MLNGGIINNLVLFLFLVIIFSKWRFTIHYWNSIRLISNIFSLFIVITVFISLFN